MTKLIAFIIAALISGVLTVAVSIQQDKTAKDLEKIIGALNGVQVQKQKIANN